MYTDRELTGSGSYIIDLSRKDKNAPWAWGDGKSLSYDLWDLDDDQSGNNHNYGRIQKNSGYVLSGDNSPAHFICTIWDSAIEDFPSKSYALSRISVPTLKRDDWVIPQCGHVCFSSTMNNMTERS